MLLQQTKEHICALSDSELLEYVLTGTRMYEPDAVGFAQAELNRRALPQEQVEALRPVIAQKLMKYDIRNPRDLNGIAASPSVVCLNCGVEAPTKYVEYN